MHLEGLRILGYPEFFAEKYFEENIDEMIFQDVVASLYKRNQLASLTNKITKNIFAPITVGGGIRNISDIKEILTNGADRVSINTAAINDRKFIKEAVKIFGSSTITITIETLKVGEKYEVYTDSGRTETNIDVFEWIKLVQDLGVGEISIIIAVACPHRAETYILSRYIIEEIKNRLVSNKGSLDALIAELRSR